MKLEIIYRRGFYMPFIGVIAKENDNNFIKNEIKKNAQFYKYEIVI